MSAEPTPCPDDETLAALAEGRLEGAEMERLQLHLDTCDRCQALVGHLARGLVGSEPGPTELTGAARPEGAEVLGRYVLERKLARGGMAEVFLASQLGPQGYRRTCVVKRMLPHLADEAAYVKMFLNEARLASQLSHPNIAQVLDFGQEAGTYYLAMEHVSGVTLRRLLDGEPHGLEIAVAARLIAQTARALHAAHTAVGADGARLNIVHRDVSPSNLMLSEQGLVKVIDFGIAKAVQAPTDTRTGYVKGKLGYMSPEQIRGEAVDARSDVYSLGLVLYELLTGRRAFPQATEFDLVTAVGAAAVPDLGRARPEVPAAVRRAFERCVAKDPAQRFADAASLAEALERWLEANGEGASPSELAALARAAASRPETPGDTLTGGQTTTPERRGAGPEPRRWPAVAALGAVLVVAGAGALWWTWGQGPAAVTPAEVVRPTPLPVADAGVAQVAAAPPDAAVVVAAVVDDPAPAEPAPGGGSGTGTVRPREVKPARPPGTLALTSTPTLWVRLDGAVAGRTPLELKAAPGTHEVVFFDTEQELRHALALKVESGQVRRERWTPRKGAVVFHALPYAEVRWRGTLVGVTPLKPLEVFEGVHTFELRNPETQRTETRQVTVEPDATAVVKVDLR
ncbi:MAG: protein kinase [Myxococcaceae bacterium]|nr:protein kinase [Myxococcaceae bacterium]